MSFIGYICLIMFVYYVNSLLKSPAKLIKIFFPKKSSKKDSKYKYNNPELGRFKLSKLTIKNMLKSKFIYSSDPYLPYIKYKENFMLGLENYLLYKFPTANINEINRKLKQLSEDNLNYWLDDTKSLV